MGRFIIKVDDYYLEWSEVVDAPVTFGMSLDEFKGYYQNRYGEQGMEQLGDRLERVEKFGTSSWDGHTVADMVAGNRAGPNEGRLTLEEIKRAFCERQPIREGVVITGDGWRQQPKGGDT